MNKYVNINNQKIKRFTMELLRTDVNIEINTWEDEYFIQSGTIEQVIQYFFVGNSINFCFFYNNFSDKYIFEKNTGSAAMWKLVNNPLLWDANNLVSIRLEDWPDIKRMPLAEKRIQALREVGQVLLKKYSGKAINICKEGNWDAEEIQDLIVRDFPMWRDEYNGVKFNKRARLFLVMVYGRFQKEKLIKNIERFPCLADYQLPKVLHFLGILEYTKELEVFVNNQIELPYRSDMEFEIRIRTMEAIYRISEELTKLDKKISCIQLDYYLWSISHELNEPHHLTRTIAY